MRLRALVVSALVALATGSLVVVFAETRIANADARACLVIAEPSVEKGDKAGMVFIPAGTFTMGSDRQRPEERYTRLVRVDGFWIDQHEVTNAEFAKFVEATGYITVAERDPDPKLHPGIPKEKR